MLTQEEEDEILGAIRWFHDIWRCNCSDDAPEDREAYMTYECAQSYKRGLADRERRRKLLRRISCDKG